MLGALLQALIFVGSVFWVRWVRRAQREAALATVGADGEGP